MTEVPGVRSCEPERAGADRRRALGAISAGVPGMRRSILIAGIALGVLGVAVLVSAIILAHALQAPGRPVSGGGPLFVVFVLWAMIWLVVFAYVFRTILLLLEGATGPIRRIENTLDDIIAGKDLRIVLRDKDTLFGIVSRINRLLEARPESSDHPSPPSSTDGRP